MKKRRWPKPEVASFEFVKWTPDGHLRHSKFVVVPDDKKPRAVHGVWTANSTLAFRRPFSGGVEAAEPANISLVCLGQASEYTIGPVHFGSSRRIGRAQLLCVQVYLSALADELVLRSQSAGP